MGKPLLDKLWGAYASAWLCDAIMTLFLVKRGVVLESNPVMAHLMSRVGWLTLGIGFAMVCFIGFCLRIGATGSFPVRLRCLQWGPVVADAQRPRIMCVVMSLVLCAQLGIYIRNWINFVSP